MYAVSQATERNLCVQQSGRIVGIFGRIGHERLYVWRQHRCGQNAGVNGHFAAKSLQRFEKPGFLCQQGHGSTGGNQKL